MLFKHNYNRRDILKSAATVAALGAAGRPVSAMLHRPGEALLPITDPRIKAMCDASMSAATSAGATYADVRVTHTFTKRIGSLPAEQESMTLGVRVLVDGYWGFAASPVWSTDEAVRLSRAAARCAKANTLGKPRTLEIASAKPFVNGHWVTPIRDDAFEINRDEIDDFLGGIRQFIGRLPGVDPMNLSATFVRQRKAFASSEGQFCTQILYRTEGNVSFRVRDGNQQQMMSSLDTLSPASAGFEYLRDQPIRDQIRKLVEEVRADLALPAKPLDVGRYNVVLDANSVASLISQTIGTATELDRALGFEANAGGTSYITDPLEMIGSLKVGAPNISISANRSEALGAATVKWDDEGVEPQRFELVKDGILTDMQTNREGGAWLKDYYAMHKRPVISNGCANSPDAMYAPMTHSANLQLQAGSDAATYESLIAAQEKGISFKRCLAEMDFQQITGLCSGRAFELKDGKRIARLNAAGIIFRTPELWNSIVALGGVDSSRQYGQQGGKGQPFQPSYHSVTAVPVTAKELTVIDITRKS